jgi:hypothetical protein
MFIRVLAVAAFLGAATYGEDITIPFEGGSILIQNTSYNRYDSLLDLTRSQARFTVVNKTPDGWDLKLQFDGSVQCGGQTRVLSRTDKVSIRAGSLNVVVDGPEQKAQGKDSGCVVEKLNATILTAENKKLRINVATGERIDLEKQRELDAEAQAKQDAAEAAHQKRLAAEQRKKDAERDARIAKSRVEEEAKAAEERRKVRVACSGIYQNTVEKKVKDLTVGEEQQVRACQALGLYPPR